MTLYKYNGYETRVFPQISTTVEPGDVVDWPDERNEQGWVAVQPDPRFWSVVDDGEPVLRDSERPVETPPSSEPEPDDTEKEI